MQAKIDKDRLEAALKLFEDHKVYFHLEVNPGAYYRNAVGHVDTIYVRGEGPFRLFISMKEPEGLIQIDQVTHCEIDPERVFVIGYDDQQRLARMVAISFQPFSM